MTAVHRKVSARKRPDEAKAKKKGCVRPSAIPNDPLAWLAEAAPEAQSAEEDADGLELAREARVPGRDEANWPGNEDQAADDAEHCDLGDSLVIEDIESTRQRFLDLLDLESPIRFTAGDLTRIDTAGLQCLCALLLGRQARNTSHSWTSVSEELREAARRAGCTELMRFTA